MRIGIYASYIAGEKGHERNVSAHVQVPLHSAVLLDAAGHDVHLITNEFDAERHALPHMVPDGATVHLVPDGRHRPKQMRGGGAPKGYRPGPLLRQVARLRAIARDLDVLHVFGLARTAMLGGLVGRTVRGTPAVATLLGGRLPERSGPLARFLVRGLDAVVASTAYTEASWQRFGVPVHLRRHGIVRDLLEELGDEEPGPPRRVLFWRDPNEMNGADLAVAAFDRLAAEHPDLEFAFAIRPTRHEVPGIDDLAARHPNVVVHRFPYPPGTTLPGLVAGSLLVVLPFRRLTVDPQLSIAESLAAGVPTVTSDVRSCPELVEPGVTGDVVPSGDADALEASLRTLLSDRPRLDCMRRETAGRFAAVWNWDGYVEDLERLYAGLRSA